MLEGEGPDELNGASFVAAGKTSRIFRLGIEGDGDTKGEEGQFSDSSTYEGRDDEEETRYSILLGVVWMNILIDL